MNLRSNSVFKLSVILIVLSVSACGTSKLDTANPDVAVQALNSKMKQKGALVGLSANRVFVGAYECGITLRKAANNVINKSSPTTYIRTQVAANLDDLVRSPLKSVGNIYGYDPEKNITLKRIVEKYEPIAPGRYVIAHATCGNAEIGADRFDTPVAGDNTFEISTNQIVDLGNIRIDETGYRTGRIVGQPATGTQQAKIRSLIGSANIPITFTQFRPL